MFSAGMVQFDNSHCEIKNMSALGGAELLFARGYVIQFTYEGFSQQLSTSIEFNHLSAAKRCPKTLEYG